MTMKLTTLLAQGYLELLKRKEAIPETMLLLLQAWLSEINEPLWPSEHKDGTTTSYKGPIVFGHGGAFGLLNGRASVFRSIAAICGAKDPVDAKVLLNCMASRVGLEQHPKVIGEMLLYGHAAFTVKEMMSEATETFDKLIRSCPEALTRKVAIFSLADLTGYFRPEQHYEQWLEILASNADEWSRQAFGELLFLYFARRLTPWADSRISAALLEADHQVITGLCYGASEAFHFDHCRVRATDILCAGVKTSDAEIAKIVSAALIPCHDGIFVLDECAVRFIETLLESPTALKEVNGQLVETLSAAAGTRPSLVLSVTNAVLKCIGNDISLLGRSLNDAAAALTSIAITLHRQSKYRVEGLDLFEKFQRIGLREAVAALELLDRRPTQSYQQVSKYRRPPRRRPKPPLEENPTNYS